VMDLPFENPVAIDLAGNTASFDGLEMRVRMDPGVICVEALAARVDGLAAKKAKPGSPAGPLARPAPAAVASRPADDAAGIPLSAIERGTGRRWAMSCRHKRAAGNPR
jgi:hypothetical protein